VGEGPPAVTDPLPQPESDIRTKTRNTKKDKARNNLSIRRTPQLIIFDVGSRAVGCPEQLLDRGPSLTRRKKIQWRILLRAVQPRVPLLTLNGGEYALRTGT
jgi:hypothetical protein